MKTLDGLSYDQYGQIYLKGVLLNQTISKSTGYPYIVINDRTINVKRIIFMIAKVDIKNLVVVNLNGIKTDNNLDNLELMTRHECNQHHFNLRQKRKNNERNKTIKNQ